MQNPPKEFTNADMAAVEREAQYVNPEQIVTAALFAKQLQADITGIKRAAVGEGLKVSNVDMSKVMPSHILKTYRPAGIPNAAARGPVPSMPVPVEVPQPPVTPTISIPQVPVQALPSPPYPQVVITEPNKDNQLEFNFDKKARYEEVVQAIEALDKKITTLTEKINEIYLLVDKKKLKKTQADGTQVG
jgi:hypothetical protein